jgi:hypothetical protein
MLKMAPELQVTVKVIGRKVVYQLTIYVVILVVYIKIACLLYEKTDPHMR